MNTETLAIQDMEKRLKLLDQERKATFESSINQVQNNKTSMEAVKRENEELKAQLAKLFREQKAHGKSYQQREYEKMEAATSAMRKQLDEAKFLSKALRESVKAKNDNLANIQQECKPLLTDDSPMTRQIRVLENRLDKAMIKYNEAQNIRKTYEQILKRLNDERLGFDSQLQSIEKTLKAKAHDYQELQNMLRDANRLKEGAKADLSKIQNDFDDQKRFKEKELRDKKHYVQVKLDLTTMMSKREALKTKHIPLEEVPDLDHEGEEILKTHLGNVIATQSANDIKLDQEHERITKLEEQWRRLKEVTGVNDANEIIQKFLSASDTQKNLQYMTRESQAKIEYMSQKKQLLKARLEEMKYSQSAGSASRRIVDEYEQKLLESTAIYERNKTQYERTSKIIVNVKAGIEHLADKLNLDDSQSSTFLTAVNDTSEEEQMLTLLLQCEAALVKLMQTEPSPAVTPEPTKAPHDVLSSSVKLSSNNVRIPLQDNNDANAASEEEEEEGDVMDRAQVKKLSVLALEKNRKNRKKSTKATKTQLENAEDDNGQ